MILLSDFKATLAETHCLSELPY